MDAKFDDFLFLFDILEHPIGMTVRTSVTNHDS
jgi:hypothetical protein